MNKSTSRILGIILMLVIASTSWTGAKAQYWEAAVGTRAHVDGIFYLLNDVTHTAVVTNEFYDETEGDKYKYANSVIIPETFTTEDGGDPYTVIGIMGKAFYNCPDLISVDIPKSVTTIGSQAFDGSDKLEGINVNPQNNNYYTKNGILYNKLQTELIFCTRTFSGKFTVSSDITKIHEFAFNNCQGITEVVLPNGLKEIGNGAFMNCTGMKSINIPAGLTVLGNNAFRGASSLTSSINIPASISTISSEAFRGCAKIPSVTIPEGITSIGDNAFRGCSKITSIELPTTMNSLGIASFSNTGIRSIVIPTGITKIPNYAFDGCKLTSITLPEGLQAINISAFGNNGTIIERISIPQSVTYIDDYAFNGTNVSNFYINNIPSRIAIGATTPFKKTGTVIHVFSKTKSIFENATNWSKYTGCFVDDIEITHVSSITLDNETMTVLTTKPGKLNATINPEDARIKDVVFASSDEKIILIANPATGDFVAGTNEGTATITCTAADGSGVSTQCVVTVKKAFIPAESVSISNTQLSMEAGDTKNLTAQVNSGATYTGIIWVSDNEDVATVNESGEVSAISAGEATITAISQDGAARAKCTVTVTYDTFILTDGDDYTKTEDNFVKTLKYVRTFKSKTWQCFYVPFDISYDDWKDHFEIATINNLHQYDNDNDGIAETNEIEAIYQRTGKTIKAHTLCVIRTLDDVDTNNPKTITITVNNATLRKAESKTVDCSSVSTTFAFHGTDSKVSGQVMVDNNYYSMSATTGKFARATNPDKHHVNGLRWYLDIIDRSTGNSSSAKAGEISIVAIEEGEVTGIANIEGGTDNKIVSIFDANGRKMNGFLKGLNIVKYSDGTTKKIMK